MVKVYSKENCINCDKIKKILNEKGIEFEEIKDIEKAIEIGSANGIRSMPIVEMDNIVYDFNKIKQYLESV